MNFRVGMGTAVLFLDVDGVLNNEEVFLSRRYGGAPVCPECCGRLTRVLDATGAKIVLSSSWRGLRIEEKLWDRGLLPYLHEDGRTPHLSGVDALRGREIADWLSRHPEVTTYAIVDDEDDMLPEHIPYFVQTNFREGGLLDKHAERLAQILSTARE